MSLKPISATSNQENLFELQTFALKFPYFPQLLFFGSCNYLRIYFVHYKVMKSFRYNLYTYIDQQMIESERDIDRVLQWLSSLVSNRNIWELFLIQILRLLPRPIKSKSLGLGIYVKTYMKAPHITLQLAKFGIPPHFKSELSIVT